MPGISSGICLRPASREDIPVIVAVSNSSIDEEADIGFGTPRFELVFSDVERLSAAWQDPNLVREEAVWMAELDGRDRKSTRLNSSHPVISYAVFCLQKKKQTR